MPDQKFNDLIEEIKFLHDKKRSDYSPGEDSYNNIRASEDWGAPSWLGAMIRVSDKIRRLQKYARDGNLENESVEDSLLDIANYSMIALILFREEQEKNA